MDYSDGNMVKKICFRAVFFFSQENAGLNVLSAQPVSDLWQDLRTAVDIEDAYENAFRRKTVQMYNLFQIVLTGIIAYNC